MIAGTQTQYRIKIRFTYQLRIKIQNGGSLKAKKASIHKYNFFLLEEKHKLGFCMMSASKNKQSKQGLCEKNCSQELIRHFRIFQVGHGHSVLWTFGGLALFFFLSQTPICLLDILFFKSTNRVIFV